MRKMTWHLIWTIINKAIYSPKRLSVRLMVNLMMRVISSMNVPQMMKRKGHLALDKRVLHYKNVMIAKILKKIQTCLKLRTQKVQLSAIKTLNKRNICPHLTNSWPNKKCFSRKKLTMAKEITMKKEVLL